MNYEIDKDSNYWGLLAMEEAAEVQQNISKSIRFGPTTYSNKERLNTEINDLFYTLYLLEHFGWLNVPSKQEVIKYAEIKGQKRGEPFVSILNEGTRSDVE